MQKPLLVSEEVHRKLIELKMQEKAKNIDFLIDKLIIEHKKQKFQEVSELFRKKLKESGMTFNELLKRSKKIREEIADERFPH